VGVRHALQNTSHHRMSFVLVRSPTQLWNVEFVFISHIQVSMHVVVVELLPNKICLLTWL
jgi:hypothetical protein